MGEDGERTQLVWLSSESPFGAEINVLSKFG